MISSELVESMSTAVVAVLAEASWLDEDSSTSISLKTFFCTVEDI